MKTDLDKIKKDIAWLISQIKCFMSIFPAATTWSNKHFATTGNKYLKDTLVWDNGFIYKCLVDNNSNPTSNSFYWEKIGKGWLLQQEQADWDSLGGPSFIRNKPISLGGGTETDPIFVAWLASDPLDPYYLASNPAGYITSLALSPYLTIVDAATTYQPIGSYLTSINGLNISLLNNDSGYITSSSLTPYLTISSASTTYFPIPSGAISQYIDGTGALQTFPTIPTVGTWGALNYPTWLAGTPFVKMTAAGTFALDSSIYLTGITSLDVTTALGFTPYNDTNPSGYTSNLGTVTSVSALPLGTTGTDLSLTVANSTTTPVITLNVPTASATSRGALSSTDWTRFDGIDFTRKLIVSVSTGSVTGTTAETIISSMLVPANTLDAICDLFITFDYNKNTANAIPIKLYYNTSNSLAGATQISLYNAGSFRNGGFNRKFVVKGTSMDLITTVPTTSQLNNQFVDTIFVASTVITIAPTGNMFFIFTVANDLVGTTFTNKRTTVEKMKLT